MRAKDLRKRLMVKFKGEEGLDYGGVARYYSKTCLKRPLKRRAKFVFKTDYHLMQVKSIAECSKGEHSAILLTCIER